MKRPSLALVLPAALALAVSSASAGDGAVAGAAYSISNAAGGNELLVYSRSADGSLTPAGSVPTGGLGTGAGLASHGAVTLTDDGKTVLAVNPGSNSVSALALDSDGLTPIAGSTRFLNAGATDAAQVRFSPDGGMLVVTGRSSNRIDTFLVGKDGLLSDPAHRHRPERRLLARDLEGRPLHLRRQRGGRVGLDLLGLAAGRARVPRRHDHPGHDPA
jgi:hypothetical protein